MILFDKVLSYPVDPTWEDREKISNVVLGIKNTKALKVINWIVNILVSLGVCILTKCNLIAVAVAFIITDALLCAWGNYLIIQKPHDATRELLLDGAKQNLQDMKSKRDDLEIRLNAYQKANCSLMCDKSCENCEGQTMEEELNALKTYIEFENDWIEHKLTPYKEAEMEAIVATEQRPAKDYTDKAQYFAVLKEKLAFFINNHNFTFLKPIADSTDRLMTLLVKKPDGYALIPSTIYLYMDELQRILSKLVGMETLQMGSYMEDLMKVSNSLSKTIDRTISRIEQLDTSDVEISLSVLINELKKEEGMIDA